MGKTTKATPHPQSRKRRTAVANSRSAVADRETAVAERRPGVFKGWDLCQRLLRKNLKEIRKGSTQLIHVLVCSVLMHGIEADVNWYTGGNSYVTLPTAVAEKRPGIYLANAKFKRMKDIPEEDQGPETAIASITRLRWLGARNDFLKVAKCPNSVKQLGKKKHDRLMEMLNVNCDSSEVEDVE